jgi:hypothetical protein
MKIKSDAPHGFVDLENDRSCIDQSYRPDEKQASSRKLATVTCGFISLQLLMHRLPLVRLFKARSDLL